MRNPKFRDKSWYDQFWRAKPRAFGAPNQEVTGLLHVIYDSLSANGVRYPMAVDIAAGNGRYSFLLESIGFFVVSIDISGTACELVNNFARENRKNLAQVICGDYLKEDSLHNGTFELVFSSGLLEELNDGQQVDAIHKMKALVTTSGYILLKYCLEINNRGQQVKDGFVESQFDQSWAVVKKIEHLEMKDYPQGVEGENRIRTGLFCARKIA